MSTDPKRKKVSKSPWRLDLQPSQHAEEFYQAAVRLGIAEIQSKDELGDPGSEGRRKINSLIKMVLFAALEDAGKSTSFEISDKPEPFFDRARREVREGEEIPQRDAIAKFLGVQVPVQGSLLVSEEDLVAGSIKAAKILRYQSITCLEDLIREGIRRVSQELISNAVNIENVDPEAPPKISSTRPGLNWEKYQIALDKLRVELGTPAWASRKPYITVSTIATEARTNVIQIRRWISHNNIETIGAPTLEQLKEDRHWTGRLLIPRGTPENVELPNLRQP